ncbi:hypothetical protein ACP4OV_025802 [Aristida adscensionis]
MWKSAGLLAVFCALLLGACKGDDVRSYEDTFYPAFAGGPEYGVVFMNSFDFHVNLTSEKWIDLHPVLGEQKLTSVPDLWLTIALKDEPGNDGVKLAIRSDNLYLSGFTNRYGDQFAFLGERRKMPGSSQLSFTGSYNDLFGKELGYTGLSQIEINKKKAVEHFRTLSNYKAGSGPDRLHSSC